MKLPRLYAIADASCFPETNNLVHFAQELAAAGVTLLQYRDKIGSPRRILDDAVALRKNQTSADYLAIGPVFATTSKQRPDPVIGLEGVRHARALTTKPLVAIGGINRQNCLSVIDAGADSVAVISDLIASPRAAAEDFLRLFSAY